MKYIHLIITICMIMAPSLARSQDGMTTNSSEPVEITADKTLEWRRVQKQFTATGNAMAQQGTSSIAAQTLNADYREGAESSIEIFHLKALENVVLKSDANTAYGDVATYDLDKGLATLTGEGLRLVSPDQTITAQDRFEYDTNKGEAKAIGRAKVVRPKPQGGGTDTLEADTISAFFVENAQGQQALDRMTASGNVIITTPEEVITGAYGTYRAATNKATLSGGVTIKRGQNVLQGNRAEVDLTTNLSTIYAENNGKTRVRGVFYPGSEKPAAAEQ